MSTSVSVPSHRSGAPLGAFSSLRARLVAAFVLVAGLAVAAMGVIGSNTTRAELVRSVGDSLHSQANTDAWIVAATLERQVDVLQAFGLSEVVQNGVSAAGGRYNGDAAARQGQIAGLDARWRAATDDDRLIRDVLENDAASELREYSASYPDNVEVMVTDRYGALVAASVRTTDYMQGDEDWWQAAWNNGAGATFIGQPAYDESSRAYALILAVPLRSHGTQQVIGVLRATYRLSSLLALIDGMRVGDTGRARVLLPDNQILGDQGAAKLDAPLSETEIAQLSYGELTYEGISRLASTAPIGATPAVRALGWRLLLFQDRDAALKPVVAAQQAALLVATIVLLLALLLAVVVAQFISSPLRRLTVAAQRLARGDFSQRLNLARHDEVGRLADSFNAMAEALQERIAAEGAAQTERLALQEEVIRVQRDTLAELSTPLIPLSDAVLLLPLLGAIDSLRADQILQTLLEGVAERRVRCLIIDLTGVAVVDTHVARTLLHAADGVRLLGADVALVGIRAEVAQTLISLGVSFSAIATYINLQAALADLVEHEPMLRR